MDTLRFIGSILLVVLIILVALSYLIFNIRCIKIFGCNILVIAAVLLFASFFIVKVIIPMPEYYIKSQSRSMFSDGQPRIYPKLDEVVGEMLKEQGVDYTDGSLAVLGFNSMNFNVLFLCSYESNANPATAVFYFNRNLIGDLKPEAPIFLEDKPKSFTVDDGIFGQYFVEAGFEGSDYYTHNNAEIIAGFEYNWARPESAYMWVEFMGRSTRTTLLFWFVLFVITSISARAWQRKNEIPPERIFVKWTPLDKIITVTKNPSEDEYDN